MARIVAMYYEKTDHWIATDYAFCSSATIKAIRAELEAEGVIPVSDELQRKGGGTVSCQIEVEEEGEEPPSPDSGVEPPSGLTEPDEADNDDGRYDAEADDAALVEQAEGRPMDDPERSPFEDVDHQNPNEPKKVTIKAAQIGKTIGLEITIFIDGKANTIPVSLLVVEDGVSGVVVSPPHEHILLVRRSLAESLKLVWVD